MSLKNFEVVTIDFMSSKTVYVNGYDEDNVTTVICELSTENPELDLLYANKIVNLLNMEIK